MAKLRNLPQICPVPMESLIKSKKNQIVSMALSDSDHVQVSLFTFADKETVSEEEYFGDTMYLVVEGETLITKGATVYELKTGDVLCVPAHILHSIGGKGAFKVLQITLNE
ncbi:MAG: cupin [Clostridia bacterium BRH_c25]|nr:MAG: cupin [Clostridia bacterium BRH_c25]